MGWLSQTSRSTIGRLPAEVADNCTQKVKNGADTKKMHTCRLTYHLTFYLTKSLRQTIQLFSVRVTEVKPWDELCLHVRQVKPHLYYPALINTFQQIEKQAFFSYVSQQRLLWVRDEITFASLQRGSPAVIWTTMEEAYRCLNYVIVLCSQWDMEHQPHLCLLLWQRLCRAWQNSSRRSPNSC